MVKIVIPLFLLAAIAIVSTRLVWLIRHPRRRVTRKTAPSRAQRAANSTASRHPAPDSPQPSQHAPAAGLLLEPLHFRDLIPAPPRVEFEPTTSAPRGAISRIIDQAERVTDNLRERQAILSELNRAREDPHVLTELVSSDPALTTQILKTVNSPFYGLIKPVGSVFRALLLLGHVEVRNIIWRSTIRDTGTPLTGAAAALLHQLWTHASTTSRIAYAIAKDLNLPKPDEISTAALLHDVGRLICLQTWPDQINSYGLDVRFSGQELLQKEQEVLGMTHSELGAEITRVWAFPDQICMSIGSHHAPSYMPPDDVKGDPRIVAVIHLADVISHVATVQLQPITLFPVYRPADGWLELLGVKNGLEDLCGEGVLRAVAQAALERGTMASAARAA